MNPEVEQTLPLDLRVGPFLPEADEVPPACETLEVVRRELSKGELGVWIYQRKNVRDNHDVSPPDPLNFHCRAHQVFVGDHPLKDTNADDNVELSILETTHERRIAMYESKVILEYPLLWVEVQSHDLIFPVEILEGPPRAASNIQNPVLRP